MLTDEMSGGQDESVGFVQPNAAQSLTITND